MDNDSFVGIVPSLAYRLNAKFSLGVSVPIMYSMYSLEKAALNFDSPGRDGKMELDAGGFGAGVTVGFLYELTERSRIGVVYRSKISAMKVSPIFVFKT